MFCIALLHFRTVLPHLEFARCLISTVTQKLFWICTVSNKIFQLTSREKGAKTNSRVPNIFLYLVFLEVAEKKPHVYILHVSPFIRLTKIIQLLLKYFMYMYMLLSRRRPTFPPKFIFCSFYVWRFATAIQDGSQYFVLLIITDGIITDMQQTQQAIVNVIIYFQFDQHDYIILNQK